MLKTSEPSDKDWLSFGSFLPLGDLLPGRLGERFRRYWDPSFKISCTD